MTKRFHFQLNPLTRKRLRRFKAMRRAWWSFWILTLLYVLSLGAELIANNRPLYMRFEGRHYFPAFRFYPDDTFTGSGRATRPDYKRITVSDAFRENPANRAVYAPIPHGPNEIIDPASLDLPPVVTVTLTPMPRVASLTFDRDLVIQRALAAEALFDLDDEPIVGRRLNDLLPVSTQLAEAIRLRFANQSAPSMADSIDLSDDLEVSALTLSMASFRPRPVTPETLRITLRETLSLLKGRTRLYFPPEQAVPDPPRPALWYEMDDSQRQSLQSDAQQRFEMFVGDTTMVVNDIQYRIDYEIREVRWPHAPVRGHWMGLDGSGRDVLARIIYGLRTSMTFGLLLVSASVMLGIVIGAIQGYFGGKIDLFAQRMIEIWSAIPFLYVMILLGSLLGRSFALLLLCYGLFNWIGMSYYMRAEFLRLRRQPFVEAARGLGLPDRALIFRHILPNALVPVITFTPFALVGAINALAALDFLGFGLPPPTASWGELIQQAQQFGWVWWLIVYPFLALFIVMLLGVFIGEGARNAFDPVSFQRLQ